MVEARGPRPSWIKNQPYCETPENTDPNSHRSVSVRGEEHPDQHRLETIKENTEAEENHRTVTKLNNPGKINTIKNLKNAKNLLDVASSEGEVVNPYTNLTSRGTENAGPLETENQSNGEYFDDSYNFDNGNPQMKERINKMGQPHQVMQERLNNMNPLMFGDTIRLPMHI